MKKKEKFRITTTQVVLVECILCVLMNVFNIVRICIPKENEIARTVLSILVIVFASLWLISFILWIILFTIDSKKFKKRMEQDIEALNADQFKKIEVIEYYKPVDTENEEDIEDDGCQW